MSEAARIPAGGEVLAGQLHRFGLHKPSDGLLDHRDRSVTDRVVACGFAPLPAFSRVFRTPYAPMRRRQFFCLTAIAQRSRVLQKIMSLILIIWGVPEIVDERSFLGRGETWHGWRLPWEPVG